MPFRFSRKKNVPIFCRSFHYFRLSQVVRGTVEAVNESGGSADASRLEAWTLSAALVSRVLHRLFQFNADYREVRVTGGEGGGRFYLFCSFVILEVWTADFARDDCISLLKYIFLGGCRMFSGSQGKTGSKIVVA